MTRAAGDPLVVDGRPVPATALRAEVERATRALAAVGAGPGRGVAVSEATGLPVVVALEACAALGAPLLLPGTGVGRPLPAGRAVCAVVRGAAGAWPDVCPAPPAGRRFPDEASAVFWTSGSTGEPKAVVLTRGGLDYQASATAARLGLGPADTLLLPLPAAHAYGFSLLLIWRLTGARLCLETRFRAPQVLRRLAEECVTSLDGVPSMYGLLLQEARRDASVRALLGRLRVRGCGGDVLSPRLHDEFAEVVGAHLHDGYGLSEAGPGVAVTDPCRVRPGTAGPPLAGTDVRIDAGTHEIQVRSPSVMACYLDDAAATASAFTADGWLRTGDAGRLDDEGCLAISGRLKEILIVHGETWAPVVVEDVLRSQPGVADAAVVGVRGRGWRGDVVVAFVEAPGTPEAQLRTALRVACRRALPAHLRPRAIHCLAGLPRLASGKVDRRRLRESLPAEP